MFVTVVRWTIHGNHRDPSVLAVLSVYPLFFPIRDINTNSKGKMNQHQRFEPSGALWRGEMHVCLTNESPLSGAQHTGTPTPTHTFFSDSSAHPTSHERADGSHILFPTILELENTCCVGDSSQLQQRRSNDQINVELFHGLLRTHLRTNLLHEW